MSRNRASATVERRLPYYPALDGLRGIFVLGVLCFHGGFSWASGGYLGVSSFFVLSGVLITSLLLVEWEGTGHIHLRGFWARRFRRLMPAALVGLAGAVLFGHFVADAAQLARLRADVFAALFYVSNWRFMTTGLAYEELFGQPSPVQHYWSLSIEEQFYLVLPPLIAILLARRGGRRTVTLVLAALAIFSAGLMAFLFVPETSTSRIYYGSDTRAAEFLVGSLFALGFLRGGALRVPGGRGLQAAGVLALLAIPALWSLATIRSGWIFQGGMLLYCGLNLLVIAASVGPGPLRRVLGAEPLRQIGRISYGAYLYHWPIFLWLTPERTDLGAAPLFALRLGLTLGLAAVSYHGLEAGIRRGRILTGRGAAAGCAVAAGLLSVGILQVTHDVPEPWFFRGSLQRTRPMPEVPADGSGPERLMIVGDSIASSIGTGLERRAPHHGRSAWNIASFGCGIARRGERAEQAGPRLLRSECGAWADWWPVQIEKFRPAQVVVTSGPFDVATRRLPEWSRFRDLGDPVFDDWLVSEYVEAVDVLSSGGAEVVWLTTPCLEPVRIGIVLPADAFSSEKARYVNERILPRVVEARPSRVRLIDLYQRVCPGDELLQDVGRPEPLRPDGVHFSVPGSLWLADWLLPRLAAGEGGG